MDYKKEIIKLALSNTELDLNQLKFTLTCSACPEQYDVYYKEEKEPIWYIRLRHGELRADYIADGNDYTFFEENQSFDYRDWMFYSDEQRQYFLNLIWYKLLEEHKKNTGN